MRILLDTNYLLWSIAQSRRLSGAVRRILEDDTNEILFSAVSIWEIAIKSALRREDFNAGPDRISNAALDAGFVGLPVTIREAASVTALPNHHRDPFDRLLVAQALAQPAHLLTADRVLARYSELVWLHPA